MFASGAVSLLLMVSISSATTGRFPPLPVDFVRVSNNLVVEPPTSFGLPRLEPTAATPSGQILGSRYQQSTTCVSENHAPFRGTAGPRPERLCVRNLSMQPLGLDAAKLGRDSSKEASLLRTDPPTKAEQNPSSYKDELSAATAGQVSRISSQSRQNDFVGTDLLIDHPTRTELSSDIKASNAQTRHNGSSNKRSDNLRGSGTKTKALKTSATNPRTSVVASRAPLAPVTQTSLTGTNLFLPSSWQTTTDTVIVKGTPLVSLQTISPTREKVKDTSTVDMPTRSSSLDEPTNQDVSAKDDAGGETVVKMSRSVHQVEPTPVITTPESTAVVRKTSSSRTPNFVDVKPQSFVSEANSNLVDPAQNKVESEDSAIAEPLATDLLASLVSKTPSAPTNPLITVVTATPYGNDTTVTILIKTTSAVSDIKQDDSGNHDDPKPSEIVLSNSGAKSAPMGTSDIGWSPVDVIPVLLFASSVFSFA